MHRKYPEPVVLPSPHSRGHQQQQAETPANDGDTQQHDGSTSLSDEWNLEVGMAGALQ